MAQIQGSLINDAWTKAMAEYKRGLDLNQLQTVQALTSPEDIVKHMEQLEKDRMSSKSGRLLIRVKNIADRLVRFSKVVDVMTTSVDEASLIWGSLKLLLTIVHQFSEQYERICQSLVTVGESLQVVDLLAETFSHSPIVSECVVKYYCSILRFWQKAIKHYRRRKCINLIRGLWHNYNTEFGEFEAVMMRLRKETQEAAAAVDMSEAKEARQQQHNYITASIGISRSAEESRRHREIIKWLAPTNRDANHYVNDFESACKDRHTGTCEWILKKPEFQQWVDSDGTDPKVRMLWISAIAGAGKTVLAAFIIARCREHVNPSAKRPTLYFFFKNTDDEKDSLLSMTRSFLHQLFVSFGTDDLNDDLTSLQEGSGKDVMLSDERAWNLFLKHARKLSGVTIVLDALDECKFGDTDELLDRLCSLARMSEVRVIATSRREEKIHEKLDAWPCILIQRQDVDTDIESFVIAEIANMARFNSSLLRDRVIRALSSRHEGMFLWAFLMIKELKSLATVKEVEERLSTAPKDLKSMHQAIITRLSRTLSSSERLIALKLLSWVVSAVRPLCLAEVHEILRFEIRRDSANDDLLYSEKDLELICGSLVTTRNGSLQLIHLCTKEILQERPGGMSLEDPCWPFYVEARESSGRMALLCTSYIAAHQSNINSYIKADLSPTSRLEPRSDKFDLSTILTAAPFIEYAYTFWQGHLVDGDAGADVVHELPSLLSDRFTCLWLEFRLAHDPDSLWRLERNCLAIQNWLPRWSTIRNGERERKVAYLRAWCDAVLRLLQEHGRVVQKFPDELHFIDIEPFFSSPHLAGFWSQMQGEQHVRERRVDLDRGDDVEVEVEVEVEAEIETHRRLLPIPEGGGALGFFLYDERRDVFYYSAFLLMSASETLWAEDRQTGHRLPPLKKTLIPAPAPAPAPAPFLTVTVTVPQEGEFSTNSPRPLQPSVVGAVLSSNGRYLGVVYKVTHEFGTHDLYTTIWEIEDKDKLDFRDIKLSQPWARRLQCLHIPDCGSFLSHCPIAVRPDDCFCTTHGLVDPHRGVQQDLPAHPVQAKQKTLPAFSEDGHILFYFTSTGFYKVSWLDPIPTTKALQLPDWALFNATLQAVSHNGDYLVLGGPNRIDRSTMNACIMNTRTGATDKLLLKKHHGAKYWGWHFISAVFWNHSLILIQREPWQTHHRTVAYRWSNIAQGNLDYQQTTLNWSGVSRIHFHVVQKSPKAFLLVDYDRIWSEVNMNDFPASAVTKVPLHWNIEERKDFLRYQLSSDGQHLGLIYCDQAESISTKGKIFVLLIDIRRSENNTKRWELHQDAIDTIAKLRFLTSAIFSADLSILYDGHRLYDLKPATDDVNAVQFSWVQGLRYSPTEVLFSPCNQFLCFIDTPKFRLYKLSHSTRTLTKLHVRNPPASSWTGKFHPHLPVLILNGRDRAQGESIDETGQLQSYELFEVDLSSLETLKLPHPRPNFCSRMAFVAARFTPQDIVKSIEFSDCGRFLWVNLFDFKSHGVSELWCKIPKSYPIRDEHVIHQTPCFLQRSMIYDERIYRLTKLKNGLVVLELLNDTIKGELNAHVRITSIPDSMQFRECFLLPGHEEDRARVLLIPDQAYARVSLIPKCTIDATIKVLPVTLKEILTKLNEVAETRRNEKRVSEISAKSQKDELRTDG